MLNVVDIARYAYTRMQVENAAQMGVQSIWKFCDPVKHLPASTQCPNFNTAITRAVQSTNLGNQVTLQTGSPAEGYYCVNNSNALELVEKVPEPKPADCARIGRPSLKPGLYLRVDVRYTYAPLFPNLTAASLFDTQLSQTSYMRLL